MEEETAEHMSKTEDRVPEIVHNEGDMAKKVGNIETKMIIGNYGIYPRLMKSMAHT